MISNDIKLYDLTGNAICFARCRIRYRFGRIELLPVKKTGEALARYLDEEAKKKLAAVHSMLLRRFEELAFDDRAQVRWQESEPGDADNLDVGPLTEADLTGELFATSENPF